jgi:hypothetical protein
MRWQEAQKEKASLLKISCNTRESKTDLNTGILVEMRLNMHVCSDGLKNLTNRRLEQLCWNSTIHESQQHEFLRSSEHLNLFWRSTTHSCTCTTLPKHTTSPSNTAEHLSSESSWILVSWCNFAVGRKYFSTSAQVWILELSSTCG